MLTEYEYNVAELSLRVICRIGLALDWDPATKTLSPSSSVWKRATTVGYLLICVLMLTVDGIGLHNLFLAMGARAQSSESDNGSILKHGFLFVYTFTVPGWTFVLLCSILFWGGLNENLNTFNQLMAYSRSKGLVRGSGRGMTMAKRVKYLGYYQKLYYAAIGSSMVLVIVGELGVHLPRGNVLVFALVPCIIPYVLITLALLVAYQMVIYVFLIICHDELATTMPTPTRKSSIKVDDPEGNVFKAVQRYKALFVLNNLFNGSVCRGFLPASKLAFCSVAMIIFAFSLRIHPSSLAEVLVKGCCLIISLYMWGAAVIAGNMMSSVWDLANEYLRDLENRTRTRAAGPMNMNTETAETTRYVLKSIRALNPIRINIGGLYYMERDSKCTLINFIVVGTVNILLVLSNK